MTKSTKGKFTLAIIAFDFCFDFCFDFRIRLSTSIYITMNINRAIDKAFNLGAFFLPNMEGTLGNKERKRAILLFFFGDAIVFASGLLKKKKRKPRKVWVKRWLINRDTKSVYNNILRELRLDDMENLRRYLRINTETFDELVRRVTPIIEKNVRVCESL